MGFLDCGVWQQKMLDVKTDNGRFVRSAAAFRQFVKADGSTPFAPASGRYHLYVSYACPWAHRTLIMRALKKLEGAISFSSVDPYMLDNGWEFGEGFEDPIGGKKFVYEVYQAADPEYSGRVTVPVLWDKEKGTIVNNESSEIIRMLNSEFAAFADMSTDYYPEPLRAEIDEINELVYDKINNGVYKSGFASTQEAYEEAFSELFSAMDHVEKRLEGADYLVGNTLTEADIRLFTTLVRFDSVYHGHFKCNQRRLVDYPKLWTLTRRIYALPGVAETVDLPHIKNHYYGSHRSLNPRGIVPAGPELDFSL